MASSQTPLAMPLALLGRFIGRRLTVSLSLLLWPITAAAQVVEYYHLDAIGSVRAVTDQAGGVLETHDYLPFGEELCGTVPCSSVPTGQAKRFTGKERDVETGLDYFGARYYGATLGRFTSVDPVQTWRENLVDPQRWNRYAYALNNPLRYIDPDGKAAETPLDLVFFLFDIAVGVGELLLYGEVSPATWTALGIDGLALLVPGLPATGAAGRAVEVAQAAVKSDAYTYAQHAVKATQLGQQLARSTTDGVAYARIDRSGGLEPYIGKSKSKERFKERKREHATKYPHADFEFIELAWTKAGKQLDALEEYLIRLFGGPKGGKISNRRHEMSDKRYKPHANKVGRYDD